MPSTAPAGPRGPASRNRRHDVAEDFPPRFTRAADRPRTGPPAVLLAAAVTTALLAVVWYRSDALYARPQKADPREVAARGELSQDEQRTIELFERCSKSVVYISPMATRLQRTLFGYRDVIETGTGSGFIWDDRGHIITNYHVIRGAERCLVTLPDNSSHEASLVGVYPDKDIAVLHVATSPDQLQPIAVGASSDLRVGQSVYAIGNPFGLDFTLTTGVVSALNREIESLTGRTIQGVVQTDAAINPGNSGGPLLDSAGRLIGMNTMIMSRSGSSAGIGFAVPVDTINQVVPQLISHGRVIRPGLGVVLADDRLAVRLELEGVLIISVQSGSAADRAGLRPTVEARNGRIVLGDVILRIGDKPTPTQNALLDALDNYEVGQTVEVTVNRGGKQETVKVTLQAVE